MKPRQHPQARADHTPAVRRATSIGLLVLMVAGSVAILAPAPPVAAAGQIEVYKSGLTFPIALAFSSDGRIFFAEKDTGSIRIVYLANRTLLPTPFYTLPNTQNTGERGLLGLALDPGFPATPYVYAYQTYNDLANGTIYNRIVRILASGNTGVSYAVLLRMPPLSSATNHNGGVIAFGPDGKLYAVVGENANPSLSQDPMSPMGKVLRMYSNGSAPPDNPFYNNPAWYNLTYTYGHRNMFGLAFHPITGRVYVTENGPNCNDEVNLLAAGSNYGWGPTASCGSLPPPADTNRDGPSPVLPIWWWGTTICPTNAAIYRGPSFPTWQGDLFMGDCNTNRFHRLDLVPPNYDSVASDTILWTAPMSIIEVEVGPDGAIWLTTPTTIYRYWDSGKPPIASFTADPNPAIVPATVTFDGSGSSDPDGTIVSYAWDFGDSTGGSGAVTSHAYLTFGTFNVTLTVADNESFTATAYRDVVVHAPPVASFTTTPNSPVAGASVTFNASASRDPDGNIVTYAWNFGDSKFGSGAITSHPYASAGTYNVTLNVTDNDSLNGTVYHDVVVRPSPPGPRPPVADFVASPSPTNPGSPVTFDASASFDPDGTIVSYTWDFGDGSLGTGVQASHGYARKGVFGVELTVVDNLGLTNRTTRGIAVRDRAPQITSSTPGLGPLNVDAGATQTFTVIAWDPDGDVLSYTWRIDGAVAGGNTSALNFAPSAPGSHIVNVPVSDGSLIVSREWTVTVVANGLPALITSWPFLAFVAAAIAAVFLIWLTRRRRKRDGPPRSPNRESF